MKRVIILLWFLLTFAGWVVYFEARSPEPEIQPCAVDWKRAANECEEVLIRNQVALDECKKVER